jgi:site-specific recombinase XerD
MSKRVPNASEGRADPGSVHRLGSGPRRKLPKRLTREEVRVLIDQPSRRYPTGIRDRALLRLFYRAGLRCSEALSLRVRDVDLARGEVRVWEGKGGRDRTVWIDSTTVEILARWKDVRPKSEWFFCTLAGAKIHDGNVRHMVARRAAKAGIAMRVHPHMLRHTFATELLEDGFSIIEVQKLMGHAFLNTTAIYLHVVDENLRQRLAERDSAPSQNPGIL